MICAPLSYASGKKSYREKRKNRVVQNQITNYRLKGLCLVFSSFYFLSLRKTFHCEKIKHMPLPPPFKICFN